MVLYGVSWIYDFVWCFVNLWFCIVFHEFMVLYGVWWNLWFCMVFDEIYGFV
jgi:hypothetical protein